MDTQPRALILEMPVEVLTRVASNLSVTDFCSVRLTCKGLERSLFNFFSHELFRKKQFMVFPDSIDALAGISRHPALRLCLKHLIIATDNFPSYRVAYIASNAVIPGKTQAELAAFRRAVTYQMNMGEFQARMVTILGRLPNLETVDIRDFNSHRRTGDGQNTRWRSWGSATLRARTGEDLVMTTESYAPHHHLPSDTFKAIMMALALSRHMGSDLSIPRIEVHLRTHRSGLRDTAFHEPAALEEAFSEVLSGLDRLHLTIDSSDPVAWASLHKFLALSHNLTWLRLNVQSGQHMEPVNLALGSICHDATLCPTIKNPMPFPRLTRLDFGGFITKDVVLAGVYKRLSPTLRTISLRRMCLEEQKPADPDERVNPWEPLFKALRTTKICDYSLSNLSVKIQSGTRVDVSFNPGSPAGQAADFTGSPADFRTYRGEQPGLTDKILSEMVFEWPEEDDSEEDDSDGEEDFDNESDADDH